MTDEPVCVCVQMTDAIRSCFSPAEFDYLLLTLEDFLSSCNYTKAFLFFSVVQR